MSVKEKHPPTPLPLNEMQLLRWKHLEDFLQFFVSFFLFSPCSTGVATQFRLTVDIEPVGGIGDPVGPVGGGGDLHHALVPQLPHVDLQGEQSEDHQAEHGERHHLRQLLHWVQEGVDDRLQAGHDGDGLQSSQHSESPEPGQVAHVYEGGEVARADDEEVQPVPGVPQVGVVVQNESFSQNFDYHFCCVDPEKNKSRNKNSFQFSVQRCYMIRSWEQICTELKGRIGWCYN